MRVDAVAPVLHTSPLQRSVMSAPHATVRTSLPIPHSPRLTRTPLIRQEDELVPSQTEGYKVGQERSLAELSQLDKVRLQEPRHIQESLILTIIDGFVPRSLNGNGLLGR